MADQEIIYRLLAASATAAPDAAAILAPERPPLSYAQLLQQVRDVGHALRMAGIGPRDRVALVIPQGPELAVAFAAVAASATCAPLSLAYRAREYEFFLSDLRVKALLVLEGLDSAAVDVARNQGIAILELTPTAAAAGLFTLNGPAPRSGEPVTPPTADAVALILHTSGTTARPKIVPLTQANLCASARSIAASLALGRSDRLLNVMPLFHIHGLMTLLASLTATASVVCPPAFEVAKFFEWLNEFRPTWYTAVPTIHRAILGQAAGHKEVIGRSPLRFIRSCSAPLPPSVARELEQAFGVSVLEAYGMTEASHQIATNPLPPQMRRFGSVGLPSGAAVGVLDEARRPVPPGEIGEIVIRGPGVVGGYESNPEADAEAFVDGWFRTGDQGRIDDDGYIFLTGRTKEIINRGGQKISPREVDDVLLEHPAVAQAATFPVAHPTLGEDVVAAVVLRPQASAGAEELRRFAEAKLADYKVPREVLLVGEIPKGPTGKIQRLTLATQLDLTARGGRAADPTEETPTPTEATLAKIWAEVLRLDRVDIHDNFFQLGGDSILAAIVVARAAEAFRVRLPLRSVFESLTLRRLAGLIDSARGAGGSPEPARGGETDTLIAIQVGGALPPFFAGGSNPVYRELARHLGTQRPFYALDVYALQEARRRRGERLGTRLEDIAAHFVERILTVQRHGPYLVGGACEGGIVAFEVAQQLRRGGHEVGLLLIWETLAPKYYRNRALLRVVQQLRALVQTRAIFRLGRAELADLLRHERVEYSIFRSLGTYRPRPYHGAATIIRATEQPARFRDQTVGWDELVKHGLETRVVPGNHASYIRQHFLTFADQVKACLESAGAVRKPGDP